MISRWSSPIPEMMVWPVSGSVLTLNDGSSIASFCSARPSLSWLACVFGSIAMAMTGAGKSITSSTTGAFSSHRVSPVVVTRRPAAAAMFPQVTSLTSSRLFACMLRRRPIRSRFPLTRVVDRRARLDLPGVDPEVGERADERVVHDLESQRREGLGVAWAALDLAAVREPAHDRRDVERGRQVIDHRVEQRLNALVAERRADQHGDGPADHGRPAKRRAQKRSGQRALLEVRAHRLVVGLGDRLDHRGPRRRRRFPQVVRDLPDHRLGADGVVLPLEELHLHEIDDARKLVLEPVRQLDDDRRPLEPLANLAHAAVRIGADAIALVDESDARHAVLVRLPPDGLATAARPRRPRRTPPPRRRALAGCAPPRW